MSLDDKRPIIVKKVKRGEHGHHGGAWKIAYADFVTAMMAFFLLMWLLGSTTSADLKGIAEWFKNPVKVSLMGGSGAGDATSIIRGGGEDLTRSAGQVKRTETGTREIVTRVAEESTGRLDEVGRELKRLVEESPVLKEFEDQLKIDLTSEGLRIQILDEEARPMFAAGSDRLRPYAREIIGEITPLIASLPNRISITGHTDATPFGPAGGGYTNWELSADRANAARREMIRHGLQDEKVIRVTGLAAVEPLDAADPTSPANRRVAIIVLTRKRAQELMGGPERNLDVGEERVDVSRPAPPAALVEPPPQTVAAPPQVPAPVTLPPLAPAPEPEKAKPPLSQRDRGELNPIRSPMAGAVPASPAASTEPPPVPAAEKAKQLLPQRDRSELNPIRPPIIPGLPGDGGG